PVGAAWDYYCEKSNVPAGDAWLKEVKDYEARVTGKRQ
ncbi:MAG: L-rhamnose isomerase, partial [Planctomycetota bacterium]